MWLVVALLLLSVRPLAAQPVALPADCPPVPSTGPVVTFGLSLAGHPGVPKGTDGKTYFNLPMGAPAGNACAEDSQKPLPDVLHGEPGNVLSGPPSPDLLRGPGHPHVEVEVR